MSLSKISRYCLESNHFFAQDILFSKSGVQSILKERERCGEFHVLYEELRACPDNFFEYTRMSVETFDYILVKVERALTAPDTNFRKSITAKEKLFLTLRFLATGMSFAELRNSFRLGRSTVSNLIYQTCKAILEKLQRTHMPKPSTASLNEVAEEYYKKWQFPNCIGAIDEKFFRLRKPKRKGQLINDKKKVSIVVQAVVDADYKFITTEVVSRGRPGDGVTFKQTKLYELLCNNNYHVPPPTRVPDFDKILPKVLIGNEAYPLKTFLMRPYPDRGIDAEKITFNKRLSRARNSVECAFGIFIDKWRLFQNPIETNLKHARLIITAACLLHNIIREKDGNRSLDINAIIQTGENSKMGKRKKSNNRATMQAILIRNIFKYFFNKSALAY